MVNKKNRGKGHKSRLANLDQRHLHQAAKDENTSKQEVKAKAKHIEIGAKSQESQHSSANFVKDWLAQLDAQQNEQTSIDVFNPKVRLQDALQFIRQTHYLIDEIPGQISRKEVNAFLDQIARLSTNQLPVFTNELSSKEISLIYAAFTEPLYREEKQILRDMALFRSSYYTFIIGFTTWQYAFPNADMQLTLNLVYKYLQSQKELERPVFAKELLADFCSLELSDRIFVQQTVRLLEKELLIKQNYTNLSDFFQHFAIQSKSAFAATLLGYFFLMVDWTWYVKESRLLFMHLPLMIREVAAEIINRMISIDQNASKSKNFLFRQLEQVLTKRQFKKHIWPLVKSELRDSYQRWTIEDKISNHCLNNVLKRAFLLNYIEDILDVANLSPDILAVRFRNFLLIDDANQKERILFYDNATIRELLAQELPETYLVSPPLGVRMAKDALANRNLKGIIAIALSDGELKLSQMLMNFAVQRPMHNKSQAGTAVLKDWTNNKPIKLMDQPASQQQFAQARRTSREVPKANPALAFNNLAINNPVQQIKAEQAGRKHRRQANNQATTSAPNTDNVGEIRRPMIRRRH